MINAKKKKKITVFAHFSTFYHQCIKGITAVGYSKDYNFFNQQKKNSKFHRNPNSQHKKQKQQIKIRSLHQNIAKTHMEKSKISHFQIWVNSKLKQKC